MAGGFVLKENTFGRTSTQAPLPTDTITLANGLNSSLDKAYSYQTDGNPNTNTSITSSVTPLPSGNYAISITVQNSVVYPDGKISVEPPKTGIIAYAGPGEIGIRGATENPNPVLVHGIANQVIQTVNHTPLHNYGVQCAN
jgi:hypothetical protein